MMTSIDTNVLLAAVEADNVHHRAASGFLESLQDRYDVVISEFFSNSHAPGRPDILVDDAD